MSCETINNEVRHKVLHRRKGAAPKFLHHQCPKYNAIIHVVNTPAVYETLNCLLACLLVQLYNESKTGSLTYAQYKAPTFASNHPLRGSPMLQITVSFNKSVRAIILLCTLHSATTINQAQHHELHPLSDWSDENPTPAMTLTRFN